DRDRGVGDGNGAALPLCVSDRLAAFRASANPGQPAAVTTMPGEPGGNLDLNNPSPNPNLSSIPCDSGGGSGHGNEESRAVIASAPARAETTSGGAGSGNSSVTSGS
ncbi:unnamed protein product, partial [Discosporangium mesarthrocarpum]